MVQVRTVRATTILTENRMGPGFTASSLRNLPGFSLDPFLNLDHFHMSEPTFPPHPHAGFSAVTYLFEGSKGSFTNRDSLGDKSLIRPGALHWTQAARGMMHEEIPQTRGVDCHGLQMFVNLRAEYKQALPKAFHVEPEHIPEVNGAGSRVRVLAGELSGVQSPLSSLLTPVLLLDVFLESGANISIPVDRSRTCFVMSIAGSGRVGEAGDSLMPHGVAGFANDGDEVFLAAGSEGLQVLLAAGKPLREPVIFGGPFVMNTRDELQAAVARYERGEMGRLSPSF
jgi:redox-sensitive bicupin YhaK (pirin superfamily)